MCQVKAGQTYQCLGIEELTNIFQDINTAIEESREVVLPRRPVSPPLRTHTRALAAVVHPVALGVPAVAYTLKWRMLNANPFQSCCGAGENLVRVVFCAHPQAIHHGQRTYRLLLRGVRLESPPK